MFAFPGWSWDIKIYGATPCAVVMTAVNLLNRRREKPGEPKGLQQAP